MLIHAAQVALGSYHSVGFVDVSFKYLKYQDGNQGALSVHFIELNLKNDRKIYLSNR